MPQHIAEKTFFQLLERREGKAVVEDLVYNLVKSTKRTCYDSSTCRVTFMLPDKAAPAGWHSKVIGCLDAKPQLFCPAIIEREDLPSDPTADRPHSRGLLQYQLRVLANGVSAGTVQACLSSSVTCTVTSVTRGLPSATDAYDSNYFVVSFDTATCPATKASDARISDSCVVLHTPSSGVPASSMLHLLLFFSFERKVRLSSRCSPPRPPQRVHGVFPRIQPFAWIHFAHLDVAGCLKHVSNFTDRLTASTTKLQAHARKAPLLKKVQQSPLSEPDWIKTSASATESQTQSELSGNVAQDLADGDWFDPGGNKKTQNQRKANNSLVQATAMEKKNTTSSCTSAEVTCEQLSFSSWSDSFNRPDKGYPRSWY
uniref:Uncharacterized protein n=1 Tax=Hyaloperonospora arabidopsidis (strain Emoy2) TaxID=559515 RepID=M4C2E3_HYAAE